MQIFIRFLNTTYAYIPSDFDNIISMKRYVVKKSNIQDKNIIHLMIANCCGRILNDCDIIKNIIQENVTIHMFIKLSSGPDKIYDEESFIEYDNQLLSVKYSPNDTIIHILYQAIEQLVNDNKLPRNTLPDNFHLTFKGTTLPNNSIVAEYPELSKAYISFNKQDSIINTIVALGLPINHLDYYQFYPLSQRIESNYNLILEFGKNNIVNCNNCLRCNKQSNIFMPCCRKKSCMDCFNECLNNNLVCNFCSNV